MNLDYYLYFEKLIDSANQLIERIKEYELPNFIAIRLHDTFVRLSELMTNEYKKIEHRPFISIPKNYL
jgi:hypothetical protein